MHLIKFTTFVLFLGLILGCSNTEKDDRIEIDWRKAKYTEAEVSKWRAEVMPEYLLEFKYDDAKKWREIQAVLLVDVRTPPHIMELLKSDKAFTIEGRERLAKEGMIYNLLATFNRDNREEWRQTCSILMNMDRITQERCIIELVRRMQYGPKVKESAEFKINEAASGNKATILKNLSDSFDNYNRRLNEALASSGSLSSKYDMQVQKAFWASQELALIGKPAIFFLLHYARTVYLGFFNDMIHNTLVQMGEIAVHDIIEELEKSDDLETAEAIYSYKRFLVKSLGNIYHRLNYQTEVNDDGLIETTKKIRDDLQFSKKATKAITIQLRDYRPLTESQEYQFRIECIFAMRKIGEKSACVPIVELWKKLRDDEDLENQIKIALLDLSGRKLSTFKDWQKYADTLTDPEDYD